MNAKQTQHEVDEGDKEIVEPGEHLFTVSVFTRVITRVIRHPLGNDAVAAFRPLPDLDRSNERVPTFRARSLLVRLSAMAVGGTDDVVGVETVCLL